MPGFTRDIFLSEKIPGFRVAEDTFPTRPGTGTCAARELAARGNFLCHCPADAFPAPGGKRARSITSQSRAVASMTDGPMRSIRSSA